MTGRRWWAGEDGVIPFAVVGVVALGGVLGSFWVGHEWGTALFSHAGGELTVWVLRGAFWALDLIAAQAAATPVTSDWYTPVLEGPALPIWALAALVAVATLIAETIAGIVTGNTTRIVQAVIRALVAGMLATVGASLLLAIGGALSEIGRMALAASGTSVDAPLVPLQEILMDTAQQRDGAPELFITFLAGLVIVFTSLAIYFILAMRPVMLAALIVFLPVAHVLSIWNPLRRVQVRAWALGLAVLTADAAILTMFAVANTVMGQPRGVDRLIFGTFGLLLAALAPAALARVVGAPELHTAVQSMSRGTKVAAIGAGAVALKSVLLGRALTRSSGGSSGGGLASATTASALGGASGPAGAGGSGHGTGPGGGGGGGRPPLGSGGGSTLTGGNGNRPHGGNGARPGGGSGGAAGGAANNGRSANGRAAAAGGGSTAAGGQRRSDGSGWESALTRRGRADG